MTKEIDMTKKSRVLEKYNRHKKEKNGRIRVT